MKLRCNSKYSITTMYKSKALGYLPILVTKHHCSSIYQAFRLSTVLIDDPKYGL